MTELKEGIREWALNKVRYHLPYDVAEDVVQKTLIKMASKNIPQESQKSWLITALPRFINAEFKNYVAKRVKDASFDSFEINPDSYDGDTTLADILSSYESGFGIIELKLFLKQVEVDELLLQYADHEANLANILNIKPSTLRMRVKQARDKAWPAFLSN